MRIGPDMRMAVVGSPAYFAERPVPRRPHDLAGHVCINLRYTAEGGVAVWEFEQGGRTINVRAEGQLLVNDIALARLGALNGAGLAYLPDDYVEPFIASGDLVPVLADWCELFSGYHLYYPSRRQHSAAFAVIVDALRYHG
jgi:DNA-binding transcriptional LysR family regulator